jgi:CPA1 family monovalent cation:H+ antiporter
LAGRVFDEWGFVQRLRTMFTPDVRPCAMETVRLASLTNLHPLSFEQLRELAPCASERYVEAGGRLLLDGPLHQQLVLIASGRVAVRCAGEQIAELGPGDVFGELAPQRATYATAKVVALTDLRLVLFSTRLLRRLGQTSPDALEALIWTCAAAPAERAETRGVDRRSTPELALVPAAAA